MGYLGVSNFNFNFNFSAARTGAGARVRGNTHDFSKLVDLSTDVLVPKDAGAMRFPANWDPELRAAIYVNEFLTSYPAWEARLRAVIGRPPTDLSAVELEREIREMLNSAVERERRFMEIVQQHDGDGAIDYWLGMLMIEPAHCPATYLLIRVARKLGELLVMCLKGHFRCPRPSQLCPALVPMIDPPVTPAFPAGHALQSQLISLCLDAAWPDRADPRFVFELAQRVADNRVIAGLHFPRDNDAGRLAASECFAMLRDPVKCPKFNELVARAGSEYGHRDEDR